MSTVAQTANLVQKQRASPPVGKPALADVIESLEANVARLASCVERLGYANGVLFGYHESEPDSPGKELLSGNLAGRLADAEIKVLKGVNLLEERIDYLISNLGR